jgi:hypothetical protein
MKVLPKSKAGWAKLVLLPFEVYVAAAWVFVHVYRDSAGRHWEPSDVEPFFLGYILCIPVLLVGGIFQSFSGRVKDSLITFAAAALAVLILWVLPSPLAK